MFYSSGGLIFACLKMLLAVLIGTSLTGVCNRNFSGLCRVLELPVVANGVDEVPAVMLQHPDNIPRRV
jgi:hypothetical protein